jgi:hypothetical protein
MEYLLLIYGNEAALQNRPKEVATQTTAAYIAYAQAMKDAGVLKAVSRLRPSAEATTLRAPNGKKSVQNGPFAETKEQLGGYFLIEAPDLDAALAWAARCPATGHGAVEVRPVWAM